MWESFSFGWHACNYLADHLQDVDVVYANTWPLLGQALVARLCSRRRVPLVLHIQDVYPESLLGRLSGLSRRIVRAPLTALDRWTARQAKSVVVISENMQRTYVEDRGLPQERVATIFDWQDESRFVNLPDRTDVCARHGVPAERFTFVYLGNIGPVAGVELLIKAFGEASAGNAQLLIVGEGSNKARCMSVASDLRLATVRFLSCPTPFDAPILQTMAHVCLLPLRRGAGMSSIPSKLMAYLLSAKPVLATVDSESDTARCIQEAKCGWVGEPEDVGQLALKMAEVARLPLSVLQQMGQCGRSYGLEHFSRAEGVRRLAAVIQDAANHTMITQR
jgi:glycosyltransferase involved in cell wall biosynthesis